MFSRFDSLFLLTALIDLSILVLAIALVMRHTSRSKALWLLVSAVTALNSLYGTAMVKIDKGLGRGGSLWHRVALPPDINFTIDLVSRVTLLIAIWLFVMHLVKTRTRDEVA
jgi:hypothetical protein